MSLGAKVLAPLVLVVVYLIAVSPATPAASLITNGSFESTGANWLSPWYFQVKSGGAAGISQTNATKADGAYSALANVTQASASAPWLVQLSQSTFALASGQTYTVSFAAKAPVGRTIDVALQKTASPYTVYSEQRFTLTTAWQTFSFQHHAGASDSDASLHFNLAAATGSVWIDAVSLSQATATSSPSPTPSLPATTVPTPAPTSTPSVRTVSIAPVADASVRADSPSINEGFATTLVSDGQPVAVAYMRFDLRALAGNSVTKATLRMVVTNASASAQVVRPASSGSWSESTITYNNRPALGAALTTFTAGVLGARTSVDVTTGFAGKAGQLVTIGLDSAGSDAYEFYSRESPTDGVTLLLEIRRGTSPTPTPAAAATASPSPTPSSVPTASPPPAPTSPPTSGAAKGIALRPFAQYWGSNLAGMRSDFADMRAGNITWARLDLFKTAQPDAAFDGAVQAAKEYGVNLLVTVHKTAPEKDLGTEADRAAYRSWLAQMVNRYKYHVKHWMIHNEPNLHYEWNIDDTAGSTQTAYVAAVNRYVSHLRDGFETVRANDPTAKVLFAGLSEWTVERYMDVLVTTDAHKYFDIIPFHPYGRDPDRVLSRFNSFKAKLNLNPSFAAKPICVTEIGFNTSWSNKAGYVTSEQTKATYLAQTLPRLKAAGAQLPIFWYTLHENEDIGGFALTRKNKTTLQTQYLPAYYAYRDLVFPQ